MKTRRKRYWILFIITIILTIGAVSTMLPSEHANKVSLLGYKAHCSYTPISTIICIALAGFTCFVRKKHFTIIK
jgi:uncharacterized membrane protein YhaH (DUF805 family)